MYLLRLSHPQLGVQVPQIHFCWKSTSRHGRSDLTFMRIHCPCNTNMLSESVPGLSNALIWEKVGFQNFQMGVHTGRFFTFYPGKRRGLRGDFLKHASEKLFAGTPGTGGTVWSGLMRRGSERRKSWNSIPVWVLGYTYQQSSTTWVNLQQSGSLHKSLSPHLRVKKKNTSVDWWRQEKVWRDWVGIAYLKTVVGCTNPAERVLIWLLVLLFPVWEGRLLLWILLTQKMYFFWELSWKRRQDSFFFWYSVSPCSYKQRCELEPMCVTTAGRIPGNSLLYVVPYS